MCSHSPFLHLTRRLHVTVPKSVQIPRRRDGVRGLFSLSRYARGDLIIKAPLSTCIYRGARATRLMPSYHLWMSRVAPSQSDPVHLVPALQLESSCSSDDSPGGIVTFTLEPFEAATVFCLALHFVCEKFFPDCMQKNPLSLTFSADESAFLSTFALSHIHQCGVESLFSSSLGWHSSQDIHSCMEQVAKAMTEKYLESWATSDAERFLRLHEEELSSIFLSAIYAVRSRVLHLQPMGFGKVSTHCVPIIAPMLHFLNHDDASNPSCAAVVALEERCVVVRAVRSVRNGEELTLNYVPSLGSRSKPQHHKMVLHPLLSAPEQAAIDAELSWEARYQFSQRNKQLE